MELKGMSIFRESRFLFYDLFWTPDEVYDDLLNS